MYEVSETQERIEMMVTGGRSYTPLRPKMPKLDHPTSLNIYLGFMETHKRMIMGKGSVFVGSLPSHSGRVMNLFEPTEDVRNYILWENRCLESEARKAVVRDMDAGYFVD